MHIGCGDGGRDKFLPYEEYENMHRRGHINAFRNGFYSF